MRLIGQTEEGFYLQDELQGVHEDLIQKYYGVYGVPGTESSQQHGAGFNPNEDALDEGIEAEYDSSDDEESSIKCKRVKPRTRAQCPFTLPDEKQLFDTALAAALVDGDLPEDVSERDGWVWQENAQLSVGQRRLGYSVRLPAEVWKDRTILWAKALRVMVHLTERLNGMDLD